MFTKPLEDLEERKSESALQLRFVVVSVVQSQQFSSCCNTQDWLRSVSHYWSSQWPSVQDQDQGWAGSQACHHCLRKRLASGPFFLLNLISHCSRRELRGSVECGYWTLVPETQVKPGRRWETIVTTIYICIPPAPDFSHLFHEDINNTGLLESYLD